MKKYQLVIVTTFYKTIEIEAENESDAETNAWVWSLDEANDALEDAEVETEFHDLEEVTK